MRFSSFHHKKKGQPIMASLVRSGQGDIVEFFDLCPYAGLVQILPIGMAQD